jgi:hypothetical protein
MSHLQSFKCLTCNQQDWFELNKSEDVFKAVWSERKNLIAILEHTSKSNIKGLSVDIEIFGSSIKGMLTFLQEHENHKVAIVDEYARDPVVLT